MKRADRSEILVFFHATLLGALALALVFAGSAGAQISLSPDPPSGAPVGTQITWTANGTDGKFYRFSVEHPDGSVMTARDFDIYPFFKWTPMDEGRYRISVTARDAATGDLCSASEPYLVSSLVTGRDPVITPTQHPLVALYSVPACKPGKKVRVQFRPQAEGTWQATPCKKTRRHKSVNFLVAGMKAETTYEMRHEIIMGHRKKVSEPLTFTTGSLDPQFNPPVFQVLDEPGPETSRSDGVLLHALLFGVDPLLPPNPMGQDPTKPANPWLNCPVATDLEGNVIWYYREPLLPQYMGSFLMSFPPSVGGTLLIPMARPPQPPYIPFPIRAQLLREIDLAGNTIRETNVDRVNEQLVAMGHDPIYYFHHDARRLPSGHTLVMAGVEKILFGVQGEPDEPVDVVGDMVIDLDQDFQVVWAWSTFGHDKLPVTRRALRDELCVGEPMNVCGPLRLLGQQINGETVTTAHDWTHGNTVTYTPADGNIILSFRHQDWVVKIHYADGKGSGEILWRLGPEGDFEIDQALPGNDPHPWFSAQHQPMIYARNEIVIYDNSNARNEEDPQANANSRGQVYLLDEEAMVATLVTNADLGVYASFLGSAQKLSNGQYHFLSGGIAGLGPSPVPGFPSGYSQSTETDADGDILYTLEAVYDTTYRSFRMKNMYRPAGIPGDVDGDSDVDRKDLVEITRGLFRKAGGPDDPRDLDGNGWITFQDLREASSECTLPLCRPLDWITPVLGY